MTLLIAESVGSDKFKVAKELGIPIVRPNILRHLRHVTVEQYQSVSFLNLRTGAQGILTQSMHWTDDMCYWI